MPPAFNLSQDQTLQFNPSKSRSIDVGPIPTLAGQDKTFHRVSTSSFLHPSKAFAPPGRQATPAPTLIGCNFLKIGPARRYPRRTQQAPSGEEANYSSPRDLHARSSTP